MGSEKKIKKITVSEVSEPAKPVPASTKASEKTSAKAATVASNPKSQTEPKTTSASSVAKVRPRVIMKYQPRKTRAKIKVDLKTAEVVDKTTPAATSPKPDTTEPVPQGTRHVLIKTRYVAIFVILLLAGVFFGRVAIWEDQYLSAKEGSERSQVETDETSTESDDDVDTTEPSEYEIAEYHVSSHLPRYLTIRSLGIYNSRVEQSGIGANGEMSVPYNTWNTGWYVNSDLPGKIGGTAVIDGHSGDSHCIFNNLSRIQVGAEIVIEMGDEKTKYTYVVTSLVTKKIGDEANTYMETALARKPGVAQLTLITCTGDWWQQSRTYSHRLFVHAVLKQ